MKLNILTKLLVAPVVAVILTGVAIAIALAEMNSLANLTEQMYTHPLQVTRAVLETNVGIVKMHRSMKDVTLSVDDQQLVEAKIEVAKREQEVYEHLAIVKDWITGDEGAQLQAETFQLFKDWKPIRDEVIQLTENEQLKEAIEITKGKGANHVRLLNNKVKELKEYASTKAAGMLQDAKTTRQKVLLNTLFILVITIFIIGIVGAYMASNILRPIYHLTDVAKKVASGDLNQRAIGINDNEMGVFANTFNSMVKKLGDWNLTLEREVSERTKELKHSEKNLLGANLLLTSILESPDNIIMFALDTNYHYLSFNKAHHSEMKHIYDADIELGKGIFSYMPNEEDVRKAKTNYDRVLKGERFIEIQEYGEADNRFWYELIFNPIIDVFNQVTGFTVFVTNITDRKLTEERLKISEQKSSAYLENSPACTKIVNLDFNLQFMSQAGIRGLHIDNIEEYYGKPYPFGFYPDSFKVPMTRNLKKAKDTGEIITQEAPVVDVDGNEIWFHSTIVPVKDDNGLLEYLMVVSIDTTDRKKAEEELIESNEKYLSLMNSLGTGVVLHVPDTSILLSNPMASDILGISPEQLKGKKAMDPSWKFVRSDGTDLPLEEYPVNKAICLKKSFTEYSIGINRPDRNYITWVNVNASLVFDENKNIKYVTISFNDNTEQKQAEQELKESEEKFKKIFKLSPVIMTLTDIETGVYLDANEIYLSKFGFTREEVIGTKSTDLNIFLNQSAREDIIRLFNEQGFISNHEFQLRRKSGSILHSIFSSHIIELNDKKVMLTTAVDITDRKQIEIALKESEGKLNALFTSLTEMIVMHEVVLNSDGAAVDYRILDCNKVFTEITGISKEDAVGKLASEVYQANPPPYLEEFTKVGMEGTHYEFTTYYPPMDKHFMISVVSPQAGHFATITTDVSDMMQIQETILAKNKEMENYLYIASHDLRTPLVNIQGFSQRLKKQADSIKALFIDKSIEPEILHHLGSITDEDIPKTLDFILSNIQKMDNLISGLLRLSRTGRVEMNIQKIDMDELFAVIFHNLDFQIKEAKCEIHIESLPMCYGDATLLNQLFANIISNALKYSDSERTIKITVEAKKTQNRVVYTIRDTGKGIAKKHIAKIWDVFYRIDPRSDKLGEGLGLSLVKRIAEKHKGKVWVESEINKGSVFHIELHNSTFTEF